MKKKIWLFLVAFFPLGAHPDFSSYITKWGEWGSLNDRFVKGLEEKLLLSDFSSVSYVAWTGTPQGEIFRGHEVKGVVIVAHKEERATICIAACSNAIILYLLEKAEGILSFPIVDLRVKIKDIETQIALERKGFRQIGRVSDRQDLIMFMRGE